MSTYIVSTVGISILTNYLGKDWKNSIEAFNENNNSIEEKEKIRQDKKDFPGKDWYEAIMSSLKESLNKLDKLGKKSAELNVLLKIQNLSQIGNHHFFFIATDTPDGVLAARILSDFCKEYFKKSESKIIQVQGLQTKDAQEFKRKGIRELISEVYSNVINRITEQEGIRVIFNLAGGFKLVPPYMTIIAMLRKNIELYYIYDNAGAELIRLGTLPVTFEDLSKNDEIISILSLLDNSTDGITEQQLRNELGCYLPKKLEEHYYWSLFENVDGSYVLSGFGNILLKDYLSKIEKEKEKKAIFFSPDTKKDYDSLDTTLQKEFKRLIENFNKKGWLHLQNHKAKGNRRAETLKERNGKPVILIKPNLNLRIFYHESDKEFIVLGLGRHSDESYETIRKAIEEGRITVPDLKDQKDLVPFPPTTDDSQGAKR